ncbi:hypothetical protein BH23ACT5_BH23ACT5_08740 [soil metagenome]
MSTRANSRAIIAAVAVTVLWSSSWVLIRWGLDDHGLRPVGFAGLRYGVASLVLLGWVMARPALRSSLAGISWRDFARLSGLGLVFYTITQGAQFVAIDNQPAATTSLVLSTTPLVVSVVSRRLLGEAPTAGQIVGTAFIAGGALAYFSGELGSTPRTDRLADRTGGYCGGRPGGARRQQGRTSAAHGGDRDKHGSGCNGTGSCRHRNGGAALSRVGRVGPRGLAGDRQHDCRVHLVELEPATPVGHGVGGDQQHDAGSDRPVGMGLPR